MIKEKLFFEILEEIETFNRLTNYDMQFEEIYFSLMYSKPDEFHILTDWDEGKGSDPFWNEERNEHSAICFIKDMVERINKEDGERK